MFLCAPPGLGHSTANSAPKRFWFLCHSTKNWRWGWGCWILLHCRCVVSLTFLLQSQWSMRSSVPEARGPCFVQPCYAAMRRGDWTHSPSLMVVDICTSHFWNYESCRKPQSQCQSTDGSYIVIHDCNTIDAVRHVIRQYIVSKLMLLSPLYTSDCIRTAAIVTAG